jgi:hypothetical protein
MAELKIYSEREMRQAKYEARKQAEQLLEVRINQFKTVHSALYDQITNLDRYEPVEGVFVPYHLCERIVERLRDLSPAGSREIYANKLKHWMNNSDYEMLLRWERVVIKDEEVEKNPALGPKARGQD